MQGEKSRQDSIFVTSHHALLSMKFVVIHGLPYIEK